MKTPNVLPVDFKKRQAYKSIGSGVYKDPQTGAFYERPYIDGRQTWRKLKSTTRYNAIVEAGKNKAQLEMSKTGLALSPYKKTDNATIGDLCTFYIESGCPQRDETPRHEQQLVEEKRRLETLLEFWKNRRAKEVTLEDCRDYMTWRLQRVKKGCKGLRSVDMELVTLSAVYRWALKNSKKTGISFNPIGSDRTRYCKPSMVRHCRDVQPDSGDELHGLARDLFQNRRSEVLGWQVLIEAMIGQRSNEVVRLRMDAKTSKDPGFIQPAEVDGKGRVKSPALLFLHQSQSSKGTYPFVKIHPALEAALAAHRKWHQARYPESPWFFPSPFDSMQPVLKTALTFALRRITSAERRRTSHGLRSFYVNVLRSQGISDAQIALMIGHKSGGKLIVDVYGEIIPGALDWMPKKDAPAWDSLPAWKPARILPG